MTYPTATILILSVAAIVLVAWDVYVAFFNDVPNEDDTISGILFAAAQRFAGLPFAFGALSGHLFIDQPWVDPPQPWGVCALAGCGMALALVFHCFRHRYAAWICLPLGIVAGALLWPQ
jgi:hypothetical protein